MNILCGDIGGTKARLAIFDIDGSSGPIVEKSYPSNQYSSLTEISADFLSTQQGPVESAAFGIAGPISGRRCKATNLPWQIDAEQMEQELSIPSVHLINDLEATAYGIAALDGGDFVTLQQGLNDARGNRAVIAAGTGLGQAGMIWNGDKHIPFATEGGHCDFAPSSDLEFDLLSTLQRSKGRVCWEEVLSGPGLVSIYSFLLDKRQQPRPEWLDHGQISGSAAEAITTYANNHDPLCVEALKVFCRLYGAEAGNLALKIMAKGGVYIGGGIAPKILSWLQQPHFLEAFCDKGKMRPLMETIPVHVILNDRAALFGAAMYLRGNILAMG